MGTGVTKGELVVGGTKGEVCVEPVGVGVAGVVPGLAINGEDWVKGVAGVADMEAGVGFVVTEDGRSIKEGGGVNFVPALGTNLMASLYARPRFCGSVLPVTENAWRAT